MATFAVCMSAQEGGKIVWSLVASIDLNGTFATLFDRQNIGTCRCFAKWTVCSLLVFVLNQMWDELTHPLFASYYLFKKKKK